MAEVYQEAYAQCEAAQQEYYAAGEASKPLRDRDLAIKVAGAMGAQGKRVASLTDICTWFRTPLQPKGLRSALPARNLPKRPWLAG